VCHQAPVTSGNARNAPLAAGALNARGKLAQPEVLSRMERGAGSLVGARASAVRTAKPSRLVTSALPSVVLRGRQYRWSEHLYRRLIG